MNFSYPNGHNLHMDVRRSTIVHDVGAISLPDAGTIDALARLQLGALRHGFRLRLRGASAELLELIALVGLSDALPVVPQGQPEDREERLGVEEEAELDDPSLP
jgi:hypothetical protein